MEWRRRGGKRTVWRIAFVIYSTFGHSSLTTHRPPKHGCKYCSNTVPKAMKLRRSIRNNVTVSSMFSVDVVKTTEPWFSCQGC